MEAEVLQLPLYPLLNPPLLLPPQERHRANPCRLLSQQAARHRFLRRRLRRQPSLPPPQPRLLLSRLRLTVLLPQMIVAIVHQLHSSHRLLQLLQATAIKIVPEVSCQRQSTGRRLP